MPFDSLCVVLRRPAAALLAAAASAALARADPVTVAIALDTSGSIKRGELERACALSVSTLEHLPAGSDAGLFTFDDQERLLLPWGSSAADLRQALGIVGPTGRFTALHDALYEAGRRLREVPTSRKSILLITDGRDDGSTLTLEDGLRVAQDNGIPIWVVGVGAVQERVLKRIAKLTAGSYTPLAAATGPALATNMAAAPPAREPSTASAATSAEPAGSARTETRRPASAERAPAKGLEAFSGSASSAAPWIAAGAGVLVAAGIGVMVVRRRRASHADENARCPTCDGVLPSPLAACATCTAEVRARIAELEARGAAASAESSGRSGDTLERRPPIALVNALARLAPTGTDPAQGTVVLGRSDSLRSPAGGHSRPPLSPAMLQRIDNTEEYLEKTVTLTERPVLVITSGPGAGRIFDLSTEMTTSLGRAKLNDIVLEDVSVSSEHCRIRPEDGGFIVHDLKSTNGTYVNDRRVATQELVAGDVITLGETSLLFKTVVSSQ